MNQDTLQKILELFDSGWTKTALAKHFGYHRDTIAKAIKRASVDNEIVAENVKLAKQKQRLQDTQRIERKSFREHARAENMLTELHEKLLGRLNEMQFSELQSNRSIASSSKNIGIIQLSDLHFGELVNDLSSNRYDMDVASKRLQKLANRAVSVFSAEGIDKIVICCSGDLCQSNRRMTEITEYAAARTEVVLLACDILQQFIRYLVTEGFDITVASVAGNESRVGEWFDTTDFLASENFDVMIHNILSRLFEGVTEVVFLPIDNPIEKVLNINGSNILMIHGNVHSGTANTKQIETQVEKLKARFAMQNVRIDYVICGHIHSTMISNWYARSASLCGSNNYSERNLNLVSKASQNIYIVRDNGDIEGMMIDLQRCDGFEGFQFDHSNIRYFPTKESPNTMVIQSVYI